MRKHIHRPNADATLERLKDHFKRSLEPPKFCKDCRWHGFKEIPKADRFVYEHFCSYPPLLDVITGRPSNPAKNRNDASKCGQDAKYFTARAK